MSVPYVRLAELMKARCKVFNTVWNPQCLRTGNKVLRQRLRGPTLLGYYPPRQPGVKEMNQAYDEEGLLGFNPKEEDRVESLTIIKARGKGAPKKKRTKDESKKSNKKKK